MKVLELPTENCLTTTEYNPSPHRIKAEEKAVTDRALPLLYCCNNCAYLISFKNEDFEKHTKSPFTNLSPDEKNSLTII